MRCERIKILFAIHDLSVGGAEKVLINLVNNMDDSKFDITVFSLFDVGVNKQFLSDKITYRYAFKYMVRGNSHIMKLFSPKSLYRKFIKDNYDIVVSYLEGPSMRIVSGCNDKNTKIVSWIHCTIHNERELSKAFRNKKEAIECYRKSDEMIFVSEEVRTAFLNICPVKCKTEVLYNTNETDRIIELSKQPCEINFSKNRFYWCGVGKVVPNKGFDRMLRIEKRLVEAGVPAHLLILGTGVQQAELEKWTIENGMNDYVDFLGYQTNPYKYMAHCDLYVCASHSEGFSTAATEALILGTPVCTVQVSGMKEMLGDNDKWGIITENDETALYEKVRELFCNPELLELYREKAGQRGKDFSTAETVEAVQKMLRELVDKQEIKLEGYDGINSCDNSSI